MAWTISFLCDLLQKVTAQDKNGVCGMKLYSDSAAGLLEDARKVLGVRANSLNELHRRWAE